MRQAAEKVWGAAALAVKAYTYWRDGKRLRAMGSYRSIRENWRKSSENEFMMHGQTLRRCTFASMMAGVEKDISMAYKREVT